MALALVCRAYGYRFTAVVDGRATAENVSRMAALGAIIEVVDDTGRGQNHLAARLDRVAALCRADPDLVWVNQYGNPANPEVHERTTAPEILRQAGAWTRCSWPCRPAGRWPASAGTCAGPARRPASWPSTPRAPRSSVGRRARGAWSASAPEPARLRHRRALRRGRDRRRRDRPSPCAGTSRRAAGCGWRVEQRRSGRLRPPRGRRPDAGRVVCSADSWGQPRRRSAATTGSTPGPGPRPSAGPARRRVAP